MQVGRHTHARRCSLFKQICQTRTCPINAAQLHIYARHNSVQTNAKPRQRPHAVVAAQLTALATDDADGPEDFPIQSLTNFSSGQARRAAPKVPPAKLSLSLLQLGTVIALLIIGPAWLFCKCITPRVWAAAAIYCVFFGFGGIRRTLKYGKLSSRKQDAQVSTWQGRWAIATFALLVIAGQNRVCCFFHVKFSTICQAHLGAEYAARATLYSARMSAICSVYRSVVIVQRTHCCYASHKHCSCQQTWSWHCRPLGFIALVWDLFQAGCSPSHPPSPCDSVFICCPALWSPCAAYMGY